MNRLASPYYPPRSRWYSPVFKLGAAIRRVSGLESVHLPDRVSPLMFVAGLLVPGYSFLVHKEQLIGKVVLLGYGVLFFVFLVWLGYPVANFAFGLMLSAHVTSILFLLTPWLADAQLRVRIVCSLAVLFVVGAGLYAPLREVLQESCFLPLRVQNRVVVMQAFSSPHSVRRGDWIAYSLESHSVGDAHDEGGAVVTRAGIGCAAVLAVAGDRIHFTPQSCQINGVAQKRLPHMPVSGEIVVPEKNWFLWPELSISGHGNFTEATIAGAMLELAIVAEHQFLGKPFKRWFWRRQLLA